MTGWHLLKLGGAVTVVGAAAVAGLLIWPLVWPSDPDTSLALVNGRLVVETEGYVWRVEADRQRIHVTPSLLGFRAIPIGVTADTRIVVSDKLGSFGDIWKGMDVRVSYEMRDSARIATSVEVLTTAASRARAAPTEIFVPADVAAEPIAAASKNGRPALNGRAATQPAGSRQSVVPPKPAAPAAPAEAPQPNDPDAGDGSAAIDWLIKGARR